MTQLSEKMQKILIEKLGKQNVKFKGWSGKGQTFILHLSGAEYAPQALEYTFKTEQDVKDFLENGLEH